MTALFDELKTIDHDTVRIGDIQHKYTRQDLIDTTNQMIDTMLDLIADADDSYVTFVPQDPDADDPYADDEGDADLAWTLGHVIVHATASGEEGAALGATLARGVVPDWRNRYEVPWQSVTTVQQCRDRLEESRRIRMAYYDAFPDEPLLDTVWSKSKRLGDLNAIGRVIFGLKHDSDHLAQIEEIMRQAREALGEGA